MATTPFSTLLRDALRKITSPDRDDRAPGSESSWLPSGAGACDKQGTFRRRHRGLGESGGGPRRRGLDPRAVREKITRVAGQLLEAAPEDIELGDRQVYVREAPARAIALADVGFRVYYQSDKLPRELEPSLEATAHYTPARPITWANGAAHLVVVDARHLGRPRHLETPSPFTVGGFKGIAEAGTAGAPGAIVNAVNDALAPLAVRLTRQPITPDLILAALRGARG